MHVDRDVPRNTRQLLASAVIYQLNKITEKVNFTAIKKKINKNANAQNISFPALPRNLPFAVKHMLFCRRTLLRILTD